MLENYRQNVNLYGVYFSELQELKLFVQLFTKPSKQIVILVIYQLVCFLQNRNAAASFLVLCVSYTLEPDQTEFRPLMVYSTNRTTLLIFRLHKKELKFPESQ